MTDQAWSPSANEQHPECPWCGTTMRTTTSADDFTPHTRADGDMGICITCAQPVYTVVGSYGTAMRKPTPEEAAEFEVDHGDFRDHFMELLTRLRAIKGETNV